MNGWVKGVVVGLVATVLLLAAVAQFGPAHLAEPAEAEARRLEELQVVPPTGKCSKTTEHCGGTKCCQVTGMECYAKNSKWSGCLKKCPPEDATEPWSCDQSTLLLPMKPASGPPGTKLFCFEFMTIDTGSKKKSWELELARTQLLTGASIFGCEDWMVFSDVDTWLSPGPPVKLMTVKVDFPHIQKRAKTGAWINTPAFLNAWKVIKDDGRWSKNDWTIKVDTDAVFLPSRLRTKLDGQSVTDAGIYMENCKFVKYGFFGNLEVISKTAFSTFLSNLEDCTYALNWKVTPMWGEDLFMQRCMDLHGVDKVQDFNIVTDGLCEADRPVGQKKNLKWKPDCSVAKTPALHPFLKPEDYFTCLAATQA
jgi:hypothetical protein